MHITQRRNFAILLSSTLSLLLQAAMVQATQPSAATTAERIDRLIAEEVFDEQTELAPISDDETYLRRVWLDVVGDIPPPETLIAFVLDPSPDKRAQAVQELLESPHYGQNWARYWRDVIYFRALSDPARRAERVIEAELAEYFNNDRGWDQIAQEFITARGDIMEYGTTAIFAAQDGLTEETAAEMSRIFLGIQIQCAQCHDHPYDRWEREQFHELAAFFPRTGVRPVRGLTKRSFEVFSQDQFRPNRRNNNDARPNAEHRMPDLTDPSAPGTEMQPKFFLTGASLSAGAPDRERRATVAQWFTDNEWFATAVVNRMWAELVGEGFYDPVDDIGPDRQATAPQAVALLSKKFAESGYSLKWLTQTIMATEAYQREARPRRSSLEAPFAANVPQRLRSDQLFNALLSALDIDEAAISPDPGTYNPRRRNTRPPRTHFGEVFGYDPSVSRQEVVASIPQLLLMMNSSDIHQYIPAIRSNLLENLLEEIPEDRQLVEELYLRCLSRQPTEEEIQLALEHGKPLLKRKHGFEDLLWALVNSAEFQHRR